MRQSLVNLSSKLRKALLVSFISLTTAASVFAIPMHAAAQVTNPAPAAKVSFTFDDGLASAMTQAAPTLAKYGLSATDYVITGCIGMTKAPNTCHANTDAVYMSWTQVAALQSTYGWEIGSHTVTHPYLATSDATDGQPNVLTPSQVVSELTNSKTTLASHGITATDFSTPYGDYNNSTLAQIAKLYASHRGFADQRDNTWPYNDYLLNDFPVQEGTTVAQVEAKIDQAIASNTWLTLTMHDIKTQPSTDPDDYEYSTSELDQIAAYVKAKQTAGLLQSVTVNQGLVTSDSNMFPNASFNSGIASGWTTDSPTITKDAANNGSYPDPTNSVKLVSTTKEGHLFSPKVTVNPSSHYMLKSFLNVQAISSGEVGFYIDEYDAAGNWVSGQYKKAETAAFVEEMNIPYTPSSATVASASLQIIVTANSGITAYFDNPQMFDLSGATTTPPPVVTPTNLMPNGTFDSGIAAGWTTDNKTAIVADRLNNGSPANKQNSIRMIAPSSTANSHLFSPKVAVDATKNYSFSTYVNMKRIRSGEVGFYIDEYDAAGNWISGQYKTGDRTVSANAVTFSYTPSSATVASASLQVILVGNSGITAYVDDVQMFAL